MLCRFQAASGAKTVLFSLKKLTSFQQVMITLRNKFFVDWTDQYSGKILVRAVTKVIASNKYLFSFSC